MPVAGIPAYQPDTRLVCKSILAVPIQYLSFDVVGVPMLSQKKADDQETDWKKQYIQTLKELDIKEKDWEKDKQQLLRAVLKLTFTFQGTNDLLDKKLQDLKEALKQSNKGLPQTEIDQIVQAILENKKDSDTDISRTNLLINNIIQLLSTDAQFEQHIDQVNEINQEIQNSALNPISKLKPINDIIANINQSSAKNKHKPDAFKVFLKKLSEHSQTETSLADLCKRSISIRSEQEKLKAINECIELIVRKENSITDVPENKNIESETNLEYLVTLLDWITIPGKSQTKLDALKTQLQQRKDSKEIGNLLRRIALTISNAYMELQSELNETEGFLKKVTHQLNEITLQIADIETLENESFSNSVSLNEELEKQIDLIKSGVNESDSIENIKKAINTRIEVLQNNMDQFIAVEQKRKSQSENHHKELVDRLSNMEEETEQLRKCIEEEKNKAYNDALTRIPNRMAFDERMSAEFNRWKRYQNKMTLCLIDIDKFKGVNDTYGHKAGDIVLRTVAEKCASKVRKIDFLSRYGGEEFALILPETGLSAAISVAETLRESIERCTFQYGEKSVPISISCGLAELKGRDTIDTLFKRADKALYKAKETGRNRCITEDQLHLV